MTDTEAKEVVEKMRTCKDEISQLMGEYTTYKIMLQESGRPVPKDVLPKVFLR